MQQSNEQEKQPENQPKRDIRGSTTAGVVSAVLVALAASLALHAVWAVHDAQERRADVRSLVKALGLTDIALLTEARYTRHLSLADLHSPFQDAPMAIEHFPAGSLTTPTRRFPASRLETRATPKEAE